MLNIDESKFMTQKEAELRIFDETLKDISLANCDLFLTDNYNYIKMYNNKFICIESSNMDFCSCVEMIVTLTLLRKKVNYCFYDDVDNNLYDAAIREVLERFSK